MLHSGHSVCARTRCAVSGVRGPKIRGNTEHGNFRLTIAGILRIQSVYTVIATPPEPVASAARLPVSATGLPVAHISENIRIRLFLLDGTIQFRLRRPPKAVFHSHASLPVISQ